MFDDEDDDLEAKREALSRMSKHIGADDDDDYEGAVGEIKPLPKKDKKKKGGMMGGGMPDISSIAGMMG